MDWLSNHRASIDCFTKKIRCEKLRYPELEFVGDKRVLPTCVISTLKVKRLLHKGCEVYLTYVIDTSTFEMNLENISIVCEFSNVFLEDLPGLPPDGELEFGIELLSRSTFILIPPYRMAPMELKALKT